MSPARFPAGRPRLSKEASRSRLANRSEWVRLGVSGRPHEHLVAPALQDEAAAEAFDRRATQASGADWAPLVVDERNYPPSHGRSTHDRSRGARFPPVGVVRRRPCRATTREGRRVTRAPSYPADPATVEEIVAVMRHARQDRRGWRLRALIVVLWRARLRVQEALALSERDLDARRGSLLVRQGKGGRRRDIGMDDWGWDSCSPGS